MEKRGFDRMPEEWREWAKACNTGGEGPERDPREGLPPIETLQELEAYLEEECYSFLGLTIGKHRAYEGIVLENASWGWCFSSSERGKTEVVRSFATEGELVRFALRVLRADPRARAHLAAWCWSEADIWRAERELEERGIPFRRNDVPNYTAGKRAYRIYVFGRDILKLEDFRQRYWKGPPAEGAPQGRG